MFLSIYLFGIVNIHWNPSCLLWHYSLPTLFCQNCHYDRGHNLGIGMACRRSSDTPGPPESPAGRALCLWQSTVVVTSPSLNFLFPSIKYFLHFCPRELTCGLTSLHVWLQSFLFLKWIFLDFYLHWTVYSFWTFYSVHFISSILFL